MACMALHGVNYGKYDDTTRYSTMNLNSLNVELFTLATSRAVQRIYNATRFYITSFHLLSDHPVFRTPHKHRILLSHSSSSKSSPPTLKLSSLQPLQDFSFEIPQTDIIKHTCFLFLLPLPSDRLVLHHNRRPLLYSLPCII